MPRHHRRTGLDRFLTWGAACGAAAVVVVSFTMSLHALALFAARSGITGPLRYGPPVAIDGLMLVAAVLWVVRSRRGLGTLMARVVIAVSTSASILTNATASQPGIVDPEVVNAILGGAMPVAWATSRSAAPRAAPARPVIMRFMVTPRRPGDACGAHQRRTHFVK